MNAITLDRPVAAAVHFTAHQIFGLLLFREQGQTVGAIAELMRVPEDILAGAMTMAEAGEFERIPAWEGSGLKIAYERKPARYTPAMGGGAELFLPRWQRAVLRQLCRNGGTLGVAEAHAIRSTYADGVTAGMEPLHHALKSNRLEWAVKRRDGVGVFVLEGAKLDRLQALIDNRWLAADA